MLKSCDYYQYKTIMIKQLKNALGLPKRGKTEPMIEVFYKYDPQHIII